MNNKVFDIIDARCNHEIRGKVVLNNYRNYFVSVYLHWDNYCNRQYCYLYEIFNGTSTYSILGFHNV